MCGLLSHRDGLFVSDTDALWQACDFCYRRRLKCDTNKPRCSHCVLHDSSCTFEAASRKARPRRRALGEDAEPLRSQIDRLESSLSRASKRISELESLASKRNNVRDNLASHLPLSYEQPASCVGQGPRDAQLELPPLHEILSGAQRYLTTLNNMLPLFQPDRLIQSINSWYLRPDQRHYTTWAAINVVLALAYRQTPSSEATPKHGSAYYLNNAQTVLSKVIMGEANITNIQIVIGMVMLFRGTQDLKPATMLIAIAIRLAHELGLQTGRGAEYLDTPSRVERQRVFWIAYLLDRDISLRTLQPPVQNESDIDLEWPPANPDDGAGMIVAADGMSVFNSLLSRVKIAQIQGEVYKFMASSRSGTLDSYQRGESMARFEPFTGQLDI